MKRGPKGGLLAPLSLAELDSIHLATLEVLERVGIKCGSKLALEEYRKAGAEVEGDRVKIPQHLVEEALRKAPRQVLLCGRLRENDILLEGSRVYFGLGGTPTPYIRDLETGEIRRPTARDMAEATKLGDALENIDFIMSIAGAFDVPYQLEYVVEFKTLFENTSKPIVYSAPGKVNAELVLEMAAAIAGGLDELRRRPILSLYSETASPLTFTRENENMLIFAKAKVPITLGPIPMAGATGPVTLAGSAVVGNAECLASLTLIQAVSPGAPVVYSGWAGLFDPRTGRLAYGAPEFALGTNLLCAQMASYYGLPCFGFGGCSDSKAPDAQAGAEVMMNMLIAALSGVNLIHDCGYLAGGSIGSMEMAVICNEVIGYVKRILRGIRVDDEALAVDVIAEVGPEGHFLSHRHTLRNLSEVYVPELFDRRPERVWEKGGAKWVHEVAREKARKLLREHEPEPLPSEVREKLEGVVKEAREKLL